MADHRSELRRELIAAAERRTRDAPRGPVQGRVLLIAAASVVLVVAIGLAVTLDSNPAAADVFDVVVEGETIVVSVIGVIQDPEAATEELRIHGLNVTMIARPAAPSLIGDLVGASSQTLPLDFEAEGGRITVVRIPKNATGRITIEYGRKADDNEEYAASEPVPDCQDFSGRALTTGRRDAIIERYGPSIIWQEFGDTIRTDVPHSELSDGATIVTILPISPSTVLVGVSDGTDPPPGTEC